MPKRGASSGGSRRSRQSPGDANVVKPGGDAVSVPDGDVVVSDVAGDAAMPTPAATPTASPAAAAGGETSGRDVAADEAGIKFKDKDLEAGAGAGGAREAWTPANVIRVGPGRPSLPRKEASPWAPLTAHARFFLTALGTINNSSGEVEVGFTFQLIYADPLLEKLAPGEAPPGWDDERWLDVLPVVQNQKEGSTLEQVQVAAFGSNVLREYKFRGIIRCDLNLRAFPFDSQTLKIEIESDAWPAHALEYRPSHNENAKVALVAPGVYNHAEWDVLAADVRGLYVGYDWEAEGADPDQYLWHRFEFRLQVARRSGFFTGKIGVVLVTCVIIAQGSNAYPVEQLNDRLGLLTTMLLTVVAFQFVTADLLPKISYWTAFDKLFLAVYALFAGLCLQSVVVFLLLDHSESAHSAVLGGGPLTPKTARLVNAWMALFFGICSVVWIGCAVVLARRSSRYRAALRQEPIPQPPMPQLPKAVDPSQVLRVH